MAIKTVPGSVFRGRTPFPRGTYRGTIREVKDIGNDEGTYGGVGFQLQGNTAIDAEREPGGRIHFVNLTTWLWYTPKDNPGAKPVQLVVWDVNDLEDESVPYIIRQAVGSWACLAAATGAAALNAEGELQFTDDLETFIEQFRAGAFEGAEVDFKVTHRAEKRKGKLVPGGRVFTDTSFLFPEEGEEEGSEGDGDTPEPEKQPEPEETKASPAPRGSGKGKFVRRK